ncbi:MAG: hypothetical protein IJZ80_00005 [Clostridia bacterium]|nr:hypothetical protein [Clostridia bacterium]
MKIYMTPVMEIGYIDGIDCITASGLGAPGVERDISYNAIWGATALDDNAET